MGGRGRAGRALEKFFARAALVLLPRRLHCLFLSFVYSVGAIQIDHGQVEIDQIIY